jgi:hypothetical protein
VKESLAAKEARKDARPARSAGRPKKEAVAEAPAAEAPAAEAPAVEAPAPAVEAADGGSEA